jgi:hypothetical protein
MLSWLIRAASRPYDNPDNGREAFDGSPRRGDGRPSDRKVLIYATEADRVASLTLEHPDIETGGDLFGYWTHTGSPIVACAIGPGRDCRHNVTSFYQDEAYLHAAGTALYDAHGLQHVGAWHSHHRLGLNRPSGGDIQTVRSGMSRQGWERFLLLITTIEDNRAGRIRQNYFLFAGEAAPEPLRVQVLPGASPFCRADHDPREETPRRLARASWSPGPYTPSLRQAADDVFKGAWFTSDRGKELLLQTTRQLAAGGVSCRMFPGRDGSLKLVLPDGALLLGPDFPHEPPRWLEGGGPECHTWEPTFNLAQWYLQARHRHPEPSASPLAGKEL